MHVVSVNVGQIRTVEISGRREPTAFEKTATEDVVRVETDGIVGDTLGTPRSLGKHNHAVYIFPVEHYGVWEHDLGRQDLPAGSFGENLTVAGIDEESLRIGDELIIGSVRLRVIQPRIPCYKLAHFLDAPQNFPARFLRSAKVGAYCAVVAEGFLQAGNPITLVPGDPSNVTIADFVRTSQFDTHDVQRLAALLDSPDLIEGWRRRIEKLLEAASGALQGESSWSGWRRLRCVDRIEECEDIASFELADPAGSDLAPCRPGQFLTVRIDTGGTVPLIRTYTISQAYPSFDHPSRYRITVKRERRDHGAPSASAALHLLMGIDAELEARCPAGSFSLDLAADRPVVFVSSGIGITPMMAMLQSLAHAGDERHIVFVHGARSRRHRPFGDQLADLHARLPNLEVRSFHSRPGEAERPAMDHDCKGRITANDVLALAPENAAFFLCGPSTFMREIAAALAAVGIDRDRIHAEAFGSSALLPAIAVECGAQAAEAASVRLERSCIDLEWRRGDGTLLDLLEKNGFAPEASCRSGICQTCAATIVSGTVAYSAGIRAALPSQALLCSARPASDLVLDL